MENITAIVKLAKSVTVEHFFSNVADITAVDTPAEVFDFFMEQLSDACDVNGERPCYSVQFPDPDNEPLVWEPFEDEWIETLVDNINAHYNNIIQTAVDVGLITKNETTLVMR